MITADRTTDAETGDPVYVLNLYGPAVFTVYDPDPSHTDYTGHRARITVFTVLVTPAATVLAGGASEHYRTADLDTAGLLPREVSAAVRRARLWLADRSAEVAR